MSLVVSNIFAFYILAALVLAFYILLGLFLHKKLSQWFEFDMFESFYLTSGLLALTVMNMSFQFGLESSGIISRALISSFTITSRFTGNEHHLYLFFISIFIFAVMAFIFPSKETALSIS